MPASRDLPPSKLRRIVDGLLNLVYPERCLVCAGAVSRLDDCGVCPICWERVLDLRIEPPFCPCCGLPFFVFDGSGDQHLCGSCSLRTPPYSGARSFGFYRSELSRLVQALKFHGRRDLAPLLSTLLVRAFVAAWRPEDFDLIAPVPLHPRRRRSRGFNQSALLARALARRIALPVDEKALVRVRPTRPQVGLSDPERMRNVSRAFRCHRTGTVAGRRVLLVDDVMTTGATAASAAGALMSGGAATVTVLTVARAVTGME